LLLMSCSSAMALSLAFRRFQTSRQRPSRRRHTSSPRRTSRKRDGVLPVLVLVCSLTRGQGEETRLSSSV